MKTFKDLIEEHGAGDWGTDKARKRLQKDTPGQDISEISVKNKERKESVELDEGKLDKSSPIYKEYEALKKKSVADLRNIIGRSHRVVDLKGYDKAGALRQILDDRYGEKKVDAFFGFSEEVELDEDVVELEERSTGGIVKNTLGKLVFNKNYKKAKEILGDVIKRKSKEAGGINKMRHGIEYYAAQIAKQYQGVDARTLASMVEENQVKLSENYLDPNYKRNFKRRELEWEYEMDKRAERERAQRRSQPHHLYINGKIWKKAGKPVEFANFKHANAAGLSILKRDPKKQVNITHHKYYEKHGDFLKKNESLEKGTDELVSNLKKDTPLEEKLKVSDGLGAWIKDFQKSDAPQFKDADKEKRRDMAIAAFVDAGGKLEEGSETWEAGYKRRVVKTTKPEHKEKGYNWRIKGKDRPEISIKLYKEKPSFKEFTKQMKRVAGHEFGG